MKDVLEATCNGIFMGIVMWHGTLFDADVWSYAMVLGSRVVKC